MADFTNLNKYSRPQTPNVEAPDFDDPNAPEEEEDYSALGMELLAPYAQPEEAQPEQAALPQKLDLYLNPDEAAQQGPEIPNELLERDAYNPIEREDMSLRSEGPSQQIAPPEPKPETDLKEEDYNEFDQEANYSELGKELLQRYRFNTDLPTQSSMGELLANLKPRQDSTAYQPALENPSQPKPADLDLMRKYMGTRQTSSDDPNVPQPLPMPETIASKPAVPKAPAVSKDLTGGKTSGDGAATAAASKAIDTMSGQQSDLSAAQEKENKLRLIATLGQAATQIGSAFAGTKLDDSVFKQMAKDADIPVKQFKERIANEGNEANSPMSALYREYALKAMPGLSENPNFKKMTANQLKSIGVKIPQEMTAYQKLMSRLAIKRLETTDNKLSLHQKREERLTGAQAWREKEKDELDTSQVDKITKMNHGISIAEDISELKGKFDTGPIAGRVMGYLNTLGLDKSTYNKKASAFKAKVGRQLSEYNRSMSGTAVSDKEALRLATHLPKETDNDEVFAAKMQDYISELKKKKLIMLQDIKKYQGKDYLTDTKAQPATKQATAKKQPNYKSGQIVRQGGKRYQWNGSKMVEVK